MHSFVSACGNKLKSNYGELTLGAIYSVVTSDKRAIRFSPFAWNSDEWKELERSKLWLRPLYFSPSARGKALFISSSRRPSRGTSPRAATRGLTPPPPPSVRFSVVPRESAAILYIAKSFTISLGTFIIPQLNPPCFAAERYRGRFNLSFHFSPDYRGAFPRLVPNVLLLVLRFSLFVLRNFSSRVESQERSVLMRSYSPIRSVFFF